ncbi:alpha/beta fold hydrolase [Rhodococcus yananensis]|uniref:alpha/beta fold hydrolase n=1 Tax=Rhodococcus yananensis TaxID=2879464 RepID=UPI003EBCE9E4
MVLVEQLRQPECGFARAGGPSEVDVFRTADRTSMLHAMQSVMVHRQGLGDLLPRITAPTLMLAARDDAMGWQLSDAQSAVSTMPDGRAEVVAGTGHVSPLVIDADVVVKTIVEFWSSVPEQ